MTSSRPEDHGPPPTERSLDPDDWAAFRSAAHGALDSVIDHLAGLREKPVWQPASEEAKALFLQHAPREGRPLTSVLEDVRRHVEPYVVGNTHPLFMGWVHGAGTPVGMVGEMIAAGLNANCGGRNQIAHDVERQIARWMAGAFGFPPDASGLFVTGTSAANFLCLTIARNQALARAREIGVTGGSLIAYASVEAHDCVRRAMELAGLGSHNLRLVPTGADRRIRVGALRDAIARDKRDGLTPFLVVGTAGTVNTGAIDDLSALAAVARAERLWFHVDGAFGALAALAPLQRSKLAGLELADSVAFDFHKWLHVPYDAGFFLVRDPEVHRRAFAADAAYLSRTPRGLAAGEVWPCDLGMDLSRGFRALKVWMSIEHFGMDRLGESIDQTCRMARYLADRLERSSTFVLCATVDLNIVCFAPRGDGDQRRAEEIVMDVQERGEAAPSLTKLDGVTVIRAAIVNHRTTSADIDRFVTLLEAAAARAGNAAKAQKLARPRPN